MTTDYISPAFGPGSQPESQDDETLDYLEMPRDMATFERPIAPEPEDIVGMEEGKARLEAILDALRTFHVGGPSAVVSLNDLELKDLGLINQILGEGEVSIVCGGNVQAQESVLAGVWRVLSFGEDGTLEDDRVEIADYPDTVRRAVFKDARRVLDLPTDEPPQGVFNASSILSEISDKVATYKKGNETHVVNLSLLPHTEGDLMYLDGFIGDGGTVILSRGYGNCRIQSTKTQNVWWVRYYNSQDAIILNSIEIIDVPEVVCAAQEDVDDSAERLNEILEIYR